MSKSIAQHCCREKNGVRINTVHPCYIETPMVMNACDKEHRDMLIQLHPMKRLGKAQEIANGMLFLASDESSLMTGSELVMDAGYTCQ